MKDFTQLTPRQPKPSPAISCEDRQVFIKRSLSQSVERSPEVREAVLTWLLSFSGGINKKEFTLQLCKLSYKDDEAIKQLADSANRRTIKQLPRQKPPKLDTDIITALATYQLIAIEGKSGKSAIDKFLSTLPEAGVYILDVNELILEYVDYQHRGKAGDIIEAANRASILVIEGLEKPIALAYHIKDTLYQLAAVRKKDPDKYTISTWNYTHSWYISEYAEMFKHFSV